MVQQSVNGVKEVGLEEALAIVEKRKTKLVWLGSEPKEYICQRLGIKDSSMVSMDPDEVLGLGKTEAKGLDGHVFMCYHGITSRIVVSHLQKECDLDVYHLKDGITSIIGELR